jgi:hypothetical protein
VRHLAVADPCPMDRRSASRRACSPCGHFVSFRSSDGVDTIGCSWGQDTIGWLRREMTLATAPPRPGARQLAGGRRASTRSDGAALAVVAAAVGIGLLLSAFNRRPVPDPRRGLVV